MKIIYKVLSFFRKIYWFIFRPKTIGVKCLVEHNSEILCIRNTYGKMRWTLPGGGVKKLESPEEAAIREVKEEVGIDLDTINYIGHYFTDKEYSKNTVHCFHSVAPSLDFKIDNKEIEEAGWFKENNVPEYRSPAIEKLLLMKDSS